MSAAATEPPAPKQLAIIGDVFCDLSATGLSGLPSWGGDAAVASPIRMLPGGSGLNSAVQLSAFQAVRCPIPPAKPFCWLSAPSLPPAWPTLLLAR